MDLTLFFVPNSCIVQGQTLTYVGQSAGRKTCCRLSTMSVRMLLAFMYREPPAKDEHHVRSTALPERLSGTVPSPS